MTTATTTTGTGIWNKLTGADPRSQQEYAPSTSKHAPPPSSPTSRPTSPVPRDARGNVIDNRSFTEKASDVLTGDDHRREAYERERERERKTQHETDNTGGIKQELSSGGLGGGMRESTTTSAYPTTTTQQQQQLGYGTTTSQPTGTGAGYQTTGTAPTRGVDVAVGGREAARTALTQQSQYHEHQGDYCPKCSTVSNITTAQGDSFSTISNVAQVHFLDSGANLMQPSLTTEQSQPIRVWCPPQNIDSEIPARRVVVQIPARRVRVTIPGRYVTVDTGAAVQVTNKPVIRLDESESMIGGASSNIGTNQGGGMIGGIRPSSLSSSFYADTHPEDYPITNSSQPQLQRQIAQNQNQNQNQNQTQTYNDPMSRRTSAPAS